ncbi:MAG: hypothetical protein ACTS73_08020 [Arsenophonus sp. NEOnobi-MAG3]
MISFVRLLAIISSIEYERNELVAGEDTCRESEANLAELLNGL